MKIKFRDGGGSVTKWDYGRQTVRGRRRKFKSKDSWYATAMLIDKSRDGWETEYTHEIAHLLLCKKTKCQDYEFGPAIHKFRIELMANRVAKSFCKDKYWNEENVFLALWLHAAEAGINYKIRWDRMKIIPLNEGIRI